MFDLLLANGRVLDGTGGPDFAADIGIEAGQISAVGHLEGAAARERLDCGRLTICPGFIDAHCHSDALPFSSDPLPAKILQGVTTEVNGNCGSTAYPMVPDRVDLLKEHHAGLFADMPWDWLRAAEYFASLERVGPVSNIAPLVGHGALRVAALGFQNRPPTADELKLMQRLLAESLADGAVGFSSGLIYSPGFYSQTPELVALAEVMRGTGRPYCSHVRGETATLFQAHAEAIEIGERAGVPVQHSHLKAAGRSNHGRAAELLTLLERARERGVDVTGDAYPYDAGSTRMVALLPPWSQEGGRELLLERLATPAERDRIKRDFEVGIPGWENLAGAGGWDKVRVSSVDSNVSYLGKSIQQIAYERETGPVDALCDVLLEEQGRPTIVVTMMDEPDVQEILKHPLVMIGSDAIITRGKPHPRTWGTYPRVLGHYARDVGLFSQAEATRSTESPTPGQAEAVRKMTSFPAAKFGLRDRGLIRPGFAADLVVFDAATVIDRATYENPEQPPVGMPHVLVNGVFAVRDGAFTGARAGRVLRAR